MKKRWLSCLAVAGILTMGLATNVNAKTDAYLVKDASTNTVYQFGLETLKNSFLDYTEDIDAPFYEEFMKKITDFGGTYAYHDDTNKYVSFETVSEAFLNAIEKGDSFSLEKFTESPQAAPLTGLPGTLKELKITNGQKAYEDVETGSTAPEESEYLEVVEIK